MLVTTMSKDRFDYLNKLQQQVKEAQRILHNFQEECRIEAPTKRGDVVKIDDYAYRNQKMKVISINLHIDYYGDFYWKAHGEVLKKDGKPGQRRAVTTWKVKSC